MKLPKSRLNLGRALKQKPWRLPHWRHTAHETDEEALMARGVNLGPRSRVDPAGRLGGLKMPTTRVKRHRGHRQGVGRGHRRRRSP